MNKSDRPGDMAKESRLKSALRDNLRRRKAAARKTASQDDAKPAGSERTPG